MTTSVTNSLFTIQPYWLGRTWVFDAPNLGVIAEPFVAGTNIVLTQLAKTRLGKEENLQVLKNNVPSDIQRCEQESQALETMPRNTAISEKVFQSRYVRLYGTFGSQSQAISAPFEKLPLCVRANRLAAEHTEKLDQLRG